MLNLVNWLPAPLDYNPYRGREADFIEAAYQVFCTDFLQTPLRCNGKTVVINNVRTYLDREETFWHLISTESGTTGNRLPDYERCERLPWIRPIIEQIGQKSEILVWKNTRRKKRGRSKKKSVHTPVLFNDTQYPHLIILEEKKNVCMLLTSYHIPPKSHKYKKLVDEYQAYIQQTTAT